MQETQENWVQPLDQEDPLEEERATYFSTLAWRILWFDLWVGKMPWRRKYGNSLQYSCLENPMDRGVWQVTVHGGHRVRHN